MSGCSGVDAVGCWCGDGRRGGGRAGGAGRRGLAVVLVALAICGVAGGLRAQTPGDDEKARRTFDEAVDRGLAYLARGQTDDGTIGQQPPATTALALMAFLAKGYSPGLAPYGLVIDRGIDSILAAQKPEGEIAGNMYHHNIATLMLSEASGMTTAERQARMAAALARAVRVTLATQAVVKGEAAAGGWRYQPGASDSDLSHSGWGLMVLRSARNNGAPVPVESVDRAARYILRCRGGDGGFGYQPGQASGLTCTAIGLLCLELSGYHRDEITLQAGRYLMRAFQAANGMPETEFRFYGYYYCANGMYQLGGEEWRQFAPLLHGSLLREQQADGSWRGRDRENDPCYSTAMAILALSVSYCQLPIYQR